VTQADAAAANVAPVSTEPVAFMKSLLPHEFFILFVTPCLK